MRKIYPALLSIDVSGAYRLTVPDVNGCSSKGITMYEALDALRDSLAGRLCAMEDCSLPFPDPSDPSSIACSGSTVVLVDVDLLTYRISTDTHAVRKNVSMPAWLSHLADKRGLNCSQILQDALMDVLHLRQKE